MSLYELDGVVPELPADGEVWIAPGARVIGRVRLGSGASVWFNAVLRGDGEPIEVGEGTNVQDGAVLHTDRGCPCLVGPHCTIGHTAIVHGCVIGEASLIGMGATVLSGARIGPSTLVGAGALVTEGREIPGGVLAVGRPAKPVRDLTGAEIAGLRASAAGYRANAARFRAGLRPAGGPGPSS
ncbi:gamma carbonic anhydrase family protein [Amaricoccus sp.]|uniref:gamma carbonic anhydrase family protein n=1 Tax=Amaricoccus sp. TaxID=1872485 RepID=UPI001B6A581B|nr:gamma carbonic anhydrase family protein [Amaricoccus sp.]MBP7000243.1 gamma carbonic anhydrase family protein [Amaricoccus sp.]